MKTNILVSGVVCCLIASFLLLGCGGSQKKATDKDKETIERIMKTGITNGPGPGASQPNQNNSPAQKDDPNKSGLRVPKPGEGGPE